MSLRSGRVETLPNQLVSRLRRFAFGQAEERGRLLAAIAIKECNGDVTTVVCVSVVEAFTRRNRYASGARFQAFKNIPCQKIAGF